MGFQSLKAFFRWLEHQNQIIEKWHNGKTIDSIARPIAVAETHEDFSNVGVTALDGYIFRL